MKMSGKNQIIFNGLKINHRNTLSLKKIKLNIHTEKKHGQKKNNNKQMTFNGQEMPQKNM